MRRLLRRFRAGRRATAAVELALILPVIMLMAAGVVECGRLYQVSTVANRLATQYAVAWANCTESSTDTGGVCATELPNYTNAAAIGNLAPQLTPSQLTLTLAEFTVTQAGVATAIYVGGNSAGVANTTGDATQLADAKTRAASAFTLFPGPASVQYVVVVEVKYLHTLNYFAALMGPLLNNFLIISDAVTQLKS
jgi:Flp pilus assembly protein TadG